MITHKHMKQVWVYRMAYGRVHAEFDNIQECGFFEAHTPYSPEHFYRVQELRPLDHVNVKPDGYEQDTVCIPDTFTGPIPSPIAPSLVGSKDPSTGAQMTDAQYTNYLLELILQAIKER